MKKVLSVVLALVFALTTLSVLAFAAGSPTITISADKKDVKVGDIVKISVNTSANSKLATASFTVKYDKDCFEYSNATVNAKSGLSTLPNATVAGEVYVVAAATTEMSDGETNIITIDLKVTKLGGKVSIEFKEASVANGLDQTSILADVKKTANTIEFKAPVEDPTDKPVEDPTDPTDPTEKPSEECKDHKYSKWITVKNPTCKETGLKEKSCTICGDKLQEAIPVDPDAHKAGEWIVTKPATAASTGTKVKKCKYCDKVVETGTIAKLTGDEITAPAIPGTDAIA